MPTFSRKLLAWYDRHGRMDLPWQKNRDPYKIWVSEIMLQQTQVATVIPYFERFVERFPGIQALAAGGLDEVLHLWTGLGYYARARNLHQAAQIICRDHDGQFPPDVNHAYALPGIGPSTAHAVLAFAFGQHLAILDGNVKRVLARHHRVYGWPGSRPVERALWRLANDHTPSLRTADYTQAIMDLGATVCVRKRPLCTLCPVANSCRALAHQDQEALPDRAPKRDKPVRAVSMMMIKHDGRVLLEQRPPTGIWGGLWSFPEFDADTTDPGELACQSYGLHIDIDREWDQIRHSFTHFHLDITPVPARLTQPDDRVMENTGLVWYNLNAPDARGLATPVKKLLEKLR